MARQALLASETVGPADYRPVMQRINLAEQAHTVHRQWVKQSPGDSRADIIGLGQLGNGRYFATRTGRGWAGTWEATDERQACDAITSWMRRRHGDWREVPADQR